MLAILAYIYHSYNYNTTQYFYPNFNCIFAELLLWKMNWSLLQWCTQFTAEFAQPTTNNATSQYKHFPAVIYYYFIDTNGEMKLTGNHLLQKYYQDFVVVYIQNQTTGKFVWYSTVHLELVIRKATNVCWDGVWNISRLIIRTWLAIDVKLMTDEHKMWFM